MRTSFMLIIVGILLVISQSSVAQFTQDENQKLEAFQQITGAQSSIGKATNTPNFIRFPKERALDLKGATLSQKVDDFIQSKASVLGFRTAKDDLFLKETRIDQQGNKHLILEQSYQGIPVYDGQLRFHFDKYSKLSAINGNFIPNIKLSTIPALSSDAANAIALSHVKSQSKNHSTQADKYPNKVHQNKLFIFHKGLAEGIKGPIYLVYEVEVRNDFDVREFVFVDAHKGQIVEQFTGMAHALSRRLYETNTSNQIWQEGDALPGALDQWQQNELAAAEHAYYFFDHAFGWTSYDGADAEMRTVNNDPGISCPNANWNGSTANYCTGTASDDVVAHEWGHAYTEYTCGLIYAYQSGALNESFSDIWGETIDLLNAYEDSGEDHSLRTSCSNSDRWRVGEDATSFGGAIRDMWTPTCDGDPGKVTDSQYSCGTGDSGGVHSNSGVPNHAYALLVDGGTYNGQTITGIGFTKAAHIFWQAQSVYLTKTSDFAVLADALESSCADLIGLNLEGLSTTSTPAGPSGEIISAADQAELLKVLLAVELRTAPDACNYSPMLATAPDLCAGASAGNAIFYEDFESGFGSWTLSQAPVNAGTWDSRDWILDNTPPDNRTGTVAFGIDPTVGNCSSDFDNGIIRLQSPLISIPAGTPGTIEMAFDHYVSIEENYDGGNIKYSLNGGSWTLLPSAAFTANAYNKTLTVSGNDNPLAGQTAFSGADEGAVSGTWGQSQIDLSTISVIAGSTIQFRWEMSTDGCNGWDGWYIDDVRVYTCSVPAISFSTATSQANESDANVSNQCMDYWEQTISVQIDLAPSQGATLTFNSPGGSATEGSDADYSFSPGTVTLDGTNLTQDITVRIYDDAVVDGEETIIFSYTLEANGGNAIIGTSNQSHTLTIQDDDVAPGNTAVELVNENFESGLGSFTMTTSGTAGFVVGNTATANSTYYKIESTNSSQFAYVNDDVCNCTMSEVRLISPAFDLSTATSATLTFDHAFANLLAESFDLLVSTNGGTSWSSSIHSMSNTSASQGSGVYLSPWVTGVTVDLSAYVGNGAVKIAFEYNDGGGWAYGAAVDNVLINAEQVASVQTSVNTGLADEQYLGPLQTVHFYDPSSGDIMATIENLSTHDYGCTSVAVLRSGTGAAAAWSPNASHYISSKAFQINPRTNNPSGSYQITTYYTEAEIAGWESATGQDRADLFLLKTSNDITNPQASDPRESAPTIANTFGNDLSYTSTFHTGFSSFGAGPATALPVALLAFIGQKNTAGILLNWETAEEKNNDHFDLERSFDGHVFEKITQITSAGISALPNHYQYLDEEYQSGFNYYRLKQVDWDGSFIYSPIILVEVARLDKVSFFPNPVRKELHLTLPELKQEVLTLKFYNANGQQVKVEEISPEPSAPQHTLDLSTLPAGAYYLTLRSNSMSTSFKLVKME